MAQCETANNLRTTDGSWASLQLAAHIKRCVLCKLIQVEYTEGGIPPSLVHRYNLTVVHRPKDAWVGMPVRNLVVYDNHELLLKE